MIPECMVWRDGEKCTKPGIRHLGIYMCHDCRLAMAKALDAVAKKERRDTNSLRRLAEQAAGHKPVRPPIYPYRGEVSAGRFEENRNKH